MFEDSEKKTPITPKKEEVKLNEEKSSANKSLFFEMLKQIPTPGSEKKQQEEEEKANPAKAKANEAKKKAKKLAACNILSAEDKMNAMMAKLMNQ